MPQLELPRKKIRSFVLRQGRMTQAQDFALQHYWDKYGLDCQSGLDLAQIFGRVAPIILEIGFGNGETLAAIAKTHPEQDFIGIEVHRPGVGHLLMLLEQQGLANVRVFCHDAVEVLERVIPDQSLSGVHLFFPDPWPKKKHHKRRIVNAGFVGLLARKLRPGGYFHAATDWLEYAGWMLEVLAAQSQWANCSPTGDFCARPDYRPVTKFEQRGLKLGHEVRDLLFKTV